ncbi:RNA polymerase subunit sigma-70 [Winogradskyella aurantia]|uniref:RNA polymerase subunit sigma-70 n=1 Tax=Winogradskyella aurantia TaxID=1915063 RepID=A0A265USC2_9FLAO|nr:RNA polymerase subunit sigma-70 [Winogradskyella aurantia]
MEKKFIEKIQKHQGILHKICFVYSNSKADKEDLYQEIILQLWKSYPSFRKESKFSTWMYRVALNTAITLNKKAALFEKHKTQLYDEYSIAEDIDYSEDLKILYKAISKLSKIEKAIIMLWLEEKTYSEIAQIIGISKKNVSVKLVRSKKKLTKMIKKIS